MNNGEREGGRDGEGVRDREIERDGDSESWKERKWKLRQERMNHDGGGWGKGFSQLLFISQPLTRR